MSTIIRNIEKRKQLAQMVYDKYTSKMPGEDFDTDELEDEVLTSFHGYTEGLLDVVQLMVDGKSIKDIKDFIMEQMNGKGMDKPFRITECPNTMLVDYIRTTVKDELVRSGRMEKGREEAQAKSICELFIDNPAIREHLIESYNLESIRICEHCGAPMFEGYLVDDFNTYCGEECVKQGKGWSDEVFEEKISHAEEEDAPIYWTMWEG